MYLFRRVLLWLGAAVGLLLAGGFVFALIRFGPVPLTLAWAKDAPNGPAAAPPLATPFDPEAARGALAREVYGATPPPGEVRVLDRLDATYRGVPLVQLELAVDLPGGRTRPFGITLLDNSDSGGGPLIIWSSFSPRGAAIPHPDVPGAPMEGMMSDVVEFGFGRYIQTPPTDMILSHGYSFAVMHPPELVPDRAEAAEAALGVFGGEPRTGAVAAWGWAVSRALDALEGEGLADRPVIAAGHSRYGKSALWAAAHDVRIDAVISHQSGTGGASLSRGKRGETVAEITESYPHWFAPGYAEDTLTIDQHHLLALVAPRPLLLGGARRDVWSDPNGALRAAVGAAPVWEAATGRAPLAAERLDVFAPTADIAMWTRPGTHGVVEEDWPAFLDFLDAHFADAED